MDNEQTGTGVSITTADWNRFFQLLGEIPHKYASPISEYLRNVAVPYVEEDFDEEEEFDDTVAQARAVED